MASTWQKLMIQLGVDDSKFKQGMNGITAQVKKLAGVLGAAFGARELLRFGSEAVKLAAKVEGIKNAFDQLNSPGLLRNLQKATRGTVADVDLMSAAVRANNFKISLEALPKYFEFAQKRARATGESVDYLVESIVMGIGRKSAMILDNLGISLQDINDELKITPDYATAVGNIMNRELTKGGDAALTAADNLAKLSAAWKNAASEIGKGLNNAFGFDTLFADIADNLKIWGDKSLTKGQKHSYLRNFGAYDKYLDLKDKGAQGGYLPAAGLSLSMGLPTGFNMMNYLKPSGGGGGGGGIAGGGTAAGVDTDIFGAGYTESLLEANAAWEEFTKAQVNAATASKWAYAGTLSQVEGMNQLSEVATRAYTIIKDFSAVSNTLTNVFGDMFSAGIQGWDEFGKAALNAIKQMLVQLAALAATYLVLSMIPGFKEFIKLSGGFVNFISNGMGFGQSASGVAASVSSSSSQAMTLRTEISGSNLAVILGRGGNQLNSGT